MKLLTPLFGADVLEASPPAGELAELQLYLNKPAGSSILSIYDEAIKPMEDRDESCK